MDSLTQVVLGSTTALIVTRGKSPKKALLWGAVMATLPDLDVFISYDNPVERIVSHRTWTHSWLVQSLATPIFAYLAKRFVGTWSYLTWCLLIWVAWVTHSGLDALTVFGTDLFWPMAGATIVGGSVFIIDPIVTILLLVACVMAYKHPDNKHLWRNSLLLLFATSIYLGWGLYAQDKVYNKAVAQLKQQGIATQNVLVHATPFNTLLWRILVVDNASYYEAYYSVIADNDLGKLNFKQYPRYPELLKDLSAVKAVQQLRRFNHEYFSLSKLDTDDGYAIILNDLRMGSEPVYNFRFKVAENKGQGSFAVKPESLDRPDIPDGYFSQIGRRVFGH